jgi:hypothetical protein
VLELTKSAPWDKPIWDSRGSFINANIRSVANVGIVVVAAALAPVTSVVFADSTIAAARLWTASCTGPSGLNFTALQSARNKKNLSTRQFCLTLHGEGAGDKLPVI